MVGDLEHFLMDLSSSITFGSSNKRLCKFIWDFLYTDENEPNPFFLKMLCSEVCLAPWFVCEILGMNSSGYLQSNKSSLQDAHFPKQKAPVVCTKIISTSFHQGLTNNANKRGMYF